MASDLLHANVGLHGISVYTYNMLDFLWSPAKLEPLGQLCWYNTIRLKITIVSYESLAYRKSCYSINSMLLIQIGISKDVDLYLRDNYNLLTVVPQLKSRLLIER